MDASAYFSSSGPPIQQQQSGYPPRAPNQQQQYGNGMGGGQQQYQVANNSFQVCTRKSIICRDRFVDVVMQCVSTNLAGAH